MGKGFAKVPREARYVIANATVPAVLLDGHDGATDIDGLTAVDITIADGRIERIDAAGRRTTAPKLDLDRGMVWPGFVECDLGALPSSKVTGTTPFGPIAGTRVLFAIDGADSASSSRALARDSMGARCATVANASTGGAPIFFVGDVGESYSGCSCSRDSKTTPRAPLPISLSANETWISDVPS